MRQNTPPSQYATNSRSSSVSEGTGSSPAEMTPASCARTVVSNGGQLSLERGDLLLRARRLKPEARVELERNATLLRVGDRGEETRDENEGAHAAASSHREAVLRKRR